MLHLLSWWFSNAWHSFTLWLPPLASFCCFTEWFCLATFVIVLINWTSCYIATLIVFAPPLWLLPHHPTLPPSPCLSLLSYDICRPAALLKLLSSCSTSCLLHCLCYSTDCHDVPFTVLLKTSVLLRSATGLHKTDLLSAKSFAHLNN